MAENNRTRSYAPGVFSNVTINWPSAIELLVQGMTEYQATRVRMLFEAEINSTNVRPSGFKPIKGIVSSWRLGYNGATGSVAILFPLMGFVLLCSIAVIVLGARTGIGHVSKFDPTNTTHIIIARYVDIALGPEHMLIRYPALLVAATGACRHSMAKMPYTPTPRLSTSRSSTGTISKVSKRYIGRTMHPGTQS